MITRRTLLGLLCAAGFLTLGNVHAQTFPSKSITILVPYPPGGPTDLMARVLGEILARRLGSAVVIDNRPGGGGQIAGNALLGAANDGHTLLVGDLAPLAVNALLYKKFAYDPAVDFQPIASMLTMPMMVLAPLNNPANTLQDAVALARTKGRNNYASPAVGTVAHLAGELLKSAAKVELIHIPYKGSAPAMVDLIGGRVDLMFDGVGPALPYVREGKIKALAVAASRRSPVLPEVPTTAEAGYPSVEISALFGVVARAGTPSEVTQKLNDEISAAIKTPIFTKRFEDLGFEVVSMTPERFRTQIQVETGRQGAIIRANNIAVD